MKLDTTTVIALAALILGAASTVLHYIAPRTTNTWDDKLAALDDKLLAILGAIVPPTSERPAVAPAKEQP